MTAVVDPIRHTGPLARFCSWCKAWHSARDRLIAARGGRISHGICARCEEAQHRAMDREARTPRGRCGTIAIVLLALLGCSDPAPTVTPTPNTPDVSGAWLATFDVAPPRSIQIHGPDRWRLTWEQESTFLSGQLVQLHPLGHPVEEFVLSGWFTALDEAEGRIYQDGQELMWFRFFLLDGGLHLNTFGRYFAFERSPDSTLTPFAPED